MERALVLLSYYRGGAFLAEQLTSILRQDYEGEIGILLRDDGSDEALPPLPEMDGYAGPRWLTTERGDNLGPQRSFLKLLRDAGEAEVCFFADQDDVWLPEKLRIAVEALRGREAPTLWCCNYAVTDRSLRILTDRAVRLEEKSMHFLTAQMYNSFPGCVMGMNRALLLLLRGMNLSDCMMHDSLAFATAVAAGEVVYEEKPLVLHRIHDSNVVGRGFRRRGPWAWIRHKAGLLIHKEPYDLTAYADRLLACGSVHPEWLADVRLLRDYKASFLSTLRLFFHADLRRKPDPEVLSIHCKILFRLF